MRCDVIAQGIIMAVRDLDLKIPIVVRLQGKEQRQMNRCLVRLRGQTDKKHTHVEDGREKNKEEETGKEG